MILRFIKTTTLSALVFTSFAVTPVFAQDTILGGFYNTLAAINELKPTQNPEYEESDEILGGRILDKSNKVIGEVKDIIISRNGTISFLNADLNRLRLGEVPLNYQKLRINPTDSGYRAGYKDDEIEDAYADILADVETAAGNNNDLFSVKNMIGSSVKAENGRKIGKISQMLFDARGGRVLAYLVSVQHGTLRNKEIAVPLNAGNFEEKGRSSVLLVSDANADAIIEYAGKN